VLRWLLCCAPWLHRLTTKDGMCICAASGSARSWPRRMMPLVRLVAHCGACQHASDLNVRQLLERYGALSLTRSAITSTLHELRRARANRHAGMGQPTTRVIKCLYGISANPFFVCADVYRIIGLKNSTSCWPSGNRVGRMQTALQHNGQTLSKNRTKMMSFIKRQRSWSSKQ
jgi:hypothetical protein